MSRRQQRAAAAAIKVSNIWLTINIVLVLLQVASASPTATKAATTPAHDGNNKNMADSLENLVKEEVIKDVIDSKPSASLTVDYNSGVQVQQGNELKPTQVKDEPKIAIANLTLNKDKLYTLAMVDPDAPSRKEPKFREVLHCLVANIPGDGDSSVQLSKGNTLAEYIGSGPPQGTGLHRYIFLLYEQKSKLESSMKIPKTSRNGRFNFSIRKFAQENNLGEPIAANFYQAQYDDYVPTLHAQLSQG